MHVEILKTVDIQIPKKDFEAMENHKNEILQIINDLENRSCDKCKFSDICKGRL